MKLLSLDVSTKSTGWAVFENKNLIEYGCITSASTDLIKRIHIITDGIKEILNKYTIDKIVVEEVRPEMGTQNIKTHRALMWVQGYIAIMAHDNFKLEFEYIYPSEWRKTCGIKTGSGVRRESLKSKDIAFVKEKYHIDVNDDIADAIGIGYAYFYSPFNFEKIVLVTSIISYPYVATKSANNSSCSKLKSIP